MAALYIRGDNFPKFAIVIFIVFFICRQRRDADGQGAERA
jgi:hypothetical protein